MPSDAVASRWDRAIPVALVAALTANAAAFLAKGAGYVLDDWYLLRNGAFDGAWGAAGSEPGAARPGSRPVFAVLFGLFDKHPLPGILLIASVNAVAAILLYRLLRRFVPAWQAGLAAVLWAVLPTHVSTDLWLTCGIIAVSTLCLVAALTLGLRDDRGPALLLAVNLLAAASALTYEASIPMLAAGVVALPLLVRRRLDWPLVISSVLTLGACALWIVTHWFSGKSRQPWADPLKLLNANFGEGITPSGTGNGLAGPLLLLGIGAIAVAGCRMALPSFRATRDDWIVGVGTAVMLIGFLPFSRYYYEPMGAGDRVNYLSAIGGALVWVGLLGSARRLDRRLAVALVGVLLVVGAAGRWERIRLWSAAGRDADAIAAEVVARFPDPSEGVTIGPEPIVRRNVVAYLDPSNLQGALAIAYGVPHVDGRLSYDPATWDGLEGNKLDIREVSELDDTPLLGEG